MKKQLVAGLVLSLAASTAMADGWVLSGGYTNLSEDDAGIDVSLGAITGGIGYRFDSGDAFSITPEFRLGFGVGDDDVSLLGNTANVELNTLYGVAVRGEFAMSESAYAFVQPSYMNADLEVSSGGLSVSEDEWEFGIGAGVGFNLNEQIGLELMVERFGDANAITGGIRITL